MEYYTAIRKKTIGSSPCRAISKDKLLEKKKKQGTKLCIACQFIITESFLFYKHKETLERHPKKS